MNKLFLGVLALTLLGGCADMDSTRTGVHEESYTPLGSYLPRKSSKGEDERKYMDKEEFKRQQEMGIDPQGK